MMEKELPALSASRAGRLERVRTTPGRIIEIWPEDKVFDPGDHFRIEVWFLNTSETETGEYDTHLFELEPEEKGIGICRGFRIPPRKEGHCILTGAVMPEHHVRLEWRLKAHETGEVLDREDFWIWSGSRPPWWMMDYYGIPGWAWIGGSLAAVGLMYAGKEVAFRE